jgi:uncharacterized protein YfaS (alpha-2-macroglobulin family)
MSGKAVNWTYSKRELTDVPQKITDRWPEDRYTFLGRDWDADEPSSRRSISQNEGTLDANGKLPLSLETDEAAGVPFDYRSKASSPTSRASRSPAAHRCASIRRRGTSACAVRRTLRMPAKASTPKSSRRDSTASRSPASNVKVELKRMQWTSVRSGEGGGFYDWESERKEVEAGEWTITTKTEPVPLSIPITEGGEYLLIASATEVTRRRRRGHGSTRSARATPRGSATITTASTSCRRRRPTSPATPRAS